MLYFYISVNIECINSIKNMYKAYISGKFVLNEPNRLKALQ